VLQILAAGVLLGHIDECAGELPVQAVDAARSNVVHEDLLLRGCIGGSGRRKCLVLQEMVYRNVKNFINKSLEVEIS